LILKEETNMARIKGKSVVFEINGTEYAGGVSNVTFSSAVNTLGFGNYEDSLDFTCAVTGFQDTAAASLHSFLWDNPGVTVNISFAPHGNATPTAAQPWFTATGYAETVPDLGGTAGEFFVYDLNFILDGKPTRVESF
jgi:hypothetical protein